MRTLLLFCAFASLSFGQVKIQGTVKVQGLAKAGGVAGAAVCCTVIDGTSVENNSGSTTISAAHTLNLAAADQIWVYVFWGNNGGCASQTIAFADGGDTFNPQGSRVTDNFSGLVCNAQYLATSTSANATATLSVTFGSNATLFAGFEAVQIRGSANAATDQRATYDGSGGNVSPNATANVTTTNAAAIVLEGTNMRGAGVTVTPTTNGCFGVTGSTPPNTGTIYSAVQYHVLSSTATNNCSFDYSPGTAPIIQLATLH